MDEQEKNSSRSEYLKKLAAAYRATYAVGVLSIFLGLLALLASFSSAVIPGGMFLAFTFLIFGAFYLLLGFFIQRKSILALGIAVGFMGLNAIAGLLNLVQSGSPVGLIIPVAFLSQTWEGFTAIKKLK
ncbi:hypothetical protein PN466_05835 [Roseofilum reptotaenium CS-1145]|uniref:Uncharacterized protein n=1 Tax=Roseofilum reptotaenium AO1-A TaxID=1925591 RepID=A0A1L9QMR2_9CYAN|nr:MULTISPECIES: hypothetical protein [Roseofilum]MBP0029155.1 hypothetical protein [Roseofilum sp. Guam]MDB9516474.1 hypothetical protein [Roseofilum reptotaenium CS-1145]OJJ22274.1 hypothetical protein BI308_19850 [Roseofilum reptotaenium AO1-A]